MRKFHSVQYNEDHRYPAAAVAEDEGSRKSTQRKIFDVSKKYLNTDRNNLQTGFRPNTGDEFQTEFETQMTDFINLHANDEAMKSEIHPFDAQQINYFDFNFPLFLLPSTGVFCDCLCSICKSQKSLLGYLCED